MDRVGTKRGSFPSILPVIRRLPAEKAERRYVAGKEKGSLIVPGVVRQDEQKAIYVLPWDVVSRSLRRKSFDVLGEDGRSEIDDPFPLPLLLRPGRKSTRISRRRKGRADKNNHTKRLGKKAKRARRQDQRRDCVKCWTDNTG